MNCTTSRNAHALTARFGRRLVLGLGLACLLTVSLAGCGESGHEEGDPARSPLIVIGLDGAEWSVIDQMRAAGELPHFDRLIREGASGHLLNTGPQVSPVVWTTYATGHFPRQHGILDFVYPYRKGVEKRPVDSTLRREPALWNLATQAGLTSTVVGYFASWPAEPVQGRMVTDRALAGLEASVWPDELQQHIDLIRQQLWQEADGLVDRYLGWDYEPEQADDPDHPYHRAARLIRGRVSDRIIADEFFRRVMLDVLDEPGDLLIGYFRIIDFASHSLWYYHDPSDWPQPPDPELEELLGEGVRESYRFADQVLGEVLERHGGRANIVVLSDHGFGSGTGRFAPHLNPDLTGNHRPNGLFIAHGPAFRPGRIDDLSIMEVFPTLAALLGLPVADALPGEVYRPLFVESWRTEHPVQYIERYERDWQRADRVEVDDQAQRKAMQSLRGLGYIGEDVQLAKGSDDATGQADDFWSIEPGLIQAHLHGEIAWYLLRGDVLAADAVVSELREKAPELLPITLAQVKGKIELLRARVPGGEHFAPALESFLRRHLENRSPTAKPSAAEEAQ